MTTPCDLQPAESYFALLFLDSLTKEIISKAGDYNLIIISAAAGGAVFVLMVILIVCICYRR